MCYSDGTRATYNCTDMGRNIYEQIQVTVIKKNRLDDLNIKCASVVQNNSMPTMGSDLRISCSSEIKANLPDSTKIRVNQTRIKERTSF